MPDLDENVLPDDYPVYPGYLYVADGHVTQSPFKGNVGQLKRLLSAAEIRRCDIVGRQRREKEGAR